MKCPCNKRGVEHWLVVIFMINRGVSDVGFSIFADTDAEADFAF